MGVRIHRALFLVPLSVVSFVLAVSAGFQPAVENTHRVRRQLSNGPHLNQQVDLIVNFLTSDWLWYAGKKVPVDDVIEEFYIPLGFANAEGILHATEGWLYDVTTLRRIGDAKASRNDRVTNITVMGSWTDLTLGFDKCKVNVLGLRILGDMRAKINNNAFEITAMFESVNGECVTSLIDFKIKEFSDIKVKINGLGSFNNAMEEIMFTVIDSRRHEIMRNTERKLKYLIRRELPRINCDEFASLLQINIV